MNYILGVINKTTNKYENIIEKIYWCMAGTYLNMWIVIK